MSEPTSLRRRTPIAFLVALLVTPGALPAQRLATFVPVTVTLPRPPLQDTVARPAPSSGRLFAGSMIGSSVGALTGWTAAVLLVLATHGTTDNSEEAVADVAGAALLGSAGAVVLGGLGSRIGVRAAGGDGGKLGKHVLASLAGWGASTLLIGGLFADETDPNAAVEITLLVGTHGLVTALLVPKH